MHSIRRFAITLVVLGAWCSTVVGQQAQAPKTTLSPSVSARQVTASLDSLVNGFQYEELARTLETMPASEERDYFAGVLANHDGRVADSIALLQKSIARIKASNPDRAAIALHALADDYVKTYRYNDAIKAYEQLVKGFASHLDKAERKSVDDDYRTALLLKDAPPQTISFDGPIDLPTHRNPTLNTIDATLSVNGVTESWILDTGANFTAITASFARRLGVQLSKGSAQTQGITGAENNLRVAILPELKLGGATVRNVVLIVLDDSSFNVPIGEKAHYQINAVLGYPVFQALQRITFTSDGHFLGGPKSPSAQNGARLYMNQLMPLLECRVDGRPIIFSLDTGADHSIFSARYYREFPGQFNGLSKRPYGLGGAGGVKRFEAFFLPHPQLAVGSVSVEMKDVPVLPELGTDTDKLFGNLGRNLTDPYSSFTIDFENMRFQLGEKLAEKAGGAR